MPPKKTQTDVVDEGDDFSNKFTPSEMKLFTAMMANMTTTPEWDWDKVADAVGSASAGSVRERYRQIKRKFGWTTPAAKSTSAKKGKSDLIASSAPETPTKVKKATGRVGTKKGQKTLPQTPASTQDSTLPTKDNLMPAPPVPTGSTSSATVSPAALVPVNDFMGGNLGWIEGPSEDHGV